SELATDVTLHARTDVRVTVRFEGESLWAEVKDWDTGPPPGCLPPQEATTGRGLQLVDTIAANWGFERDNEGRIVWFELPVACFRSINGTVGSEASPVAVRP
ncbi:MAG TPA: ATP-binding protein, partial [Acidimicrobiales bacterium]|nr:ATP-binding protein [Acidimicrobiales bacterium]